MYSRSAQLSLSDPHLHGADIVTSLAQLKRDGWTASGVRSQLIARRWQHIGRAILRHNGKPTVTELRTAALIVLGPRALLTSFSALERAGLQGWERDEIHVLVPRGARIVRPAQLPLRVHFTDAWGRYATRSRGETDDVAHAALLAGAEFRAVRPACAVLAATVQQRLLRPVHLIDALRDHGRLRHHQALVAAAHDIAQGAQALSEIDFTRLCRRLGLPEPLRQGVRREPGGRRRYLDAEWTARSGRRVVAEVDGALHLIARQWWNDQLRQNELAIAGDVVLRFPSVAVRAGEPLVGQQLRRAIAS